MGGWCRRREACGHYLSHAPGLLVERLCLPGKDGTLGAVRPSADQVRAAALLRRIVGIWRLSAQEAGHE